ncbi:MAG: NADH-quinone oxidoreductase subunit [Campylobacterota bacterium]|nr:NADH-quinone oxidoreductase subunit [Campylobacterota bacterium]
MGFSIFIIIFATLVLISSVPIMVWMERRVAALIQDRLGPNRCNIFGVRLAGLVQGLADMIKLLFKEEYLPKHIKEKTIYFIAPAIVFASAYLTFAVIPFADTITTGEKSYIFQALPIEFGILWFLAFAGLSVYGIILAGWASHNKYGLLGALRASAQVISYEAAMGLSIVSMIIIYGSIYLNDIVLYQGGLIFGFIPAWGVVIQPLAALLFIVTAFAETNRAPFDSAEAESELVAGYHTEYGSMRFALFFMGEYMAMVASSALIVTLFFGGYQIPWLDTNALRENIKEIALAIMVVTPMVLYVFYKWVIRNTAGVNPCNIKYQNCERSVAVWIIVFVFVLVEALFGWLLYSGFGGNSAQITVAILQIATFLIKLLVINFLFIWVRWTLPRFRYDQLQKLGWYVLLPLALLNIFITGFVVVLGGF